MHDEHDVAEHILSHIPTRRDWLLSCISTIVFAVVLLLAPTWVLAEKEPELEVLRLGIVHTNDHHGLLLPFRANHEDGWGGVARRRVAIQRARADTNYYWLVLDAGDVFQGTPISNMLTGFLDLECMNQMGYDAMCLGNHEFDFGYELLRGRMTDVNFPMLCANIIDKERGRPVAEPYRIIRRGDYRIGVIGLTTETLLTETHPSISQSVAAHPALPVARSLARYLRSIGCDIIIALTHQGYPRDLAMAKAVPELDVVVGGHTHTYLDEPTLIDNVVVSQSGKWGEQIGVLRLTFTRPADEPATRFALAEVDGEYQQMLPALPEDDGMKVFIADYQQRFSAEMDVVVCTALHDFPDADIRLAESALANMVCDAMRTVTESDVTLFNAGNFRAPLYAGPVTFGDLYAVLPYDNFMMKVPVTGAKLREVLTFAGTQYGDGGFPQISGMRLRYVDMELVEVLIGDGQLPLTDDMELTMLTNDFLAVGGDGFPLSEDPYGVSYLGLEQRATFAKWASQQHEISKETDGRVVFEWVEMENPGLRD